MAHQFNDELISAYLDGELTAEEQALVEEKLNECSEHQQMLGELSALRESFQTLPTYKLDERFGERVLRAAERHMLADSNISNAMPPATNAGDELPTPSTVAMDDRRGWRMAIGSVAAVAALVLVTLFLANRDDQDTNDPVVSHHEEKKTGDDKARKLVDQTGAEDATAIESSTGKNSNNMKARSHLTFDESAESDAKPDSFSAPSNVVGQKQAPVAAAAQNNAGEGSSAAPGQTGNTAPVVDEYGGFGGGAGNKRATLGGRSNLVLDANKSPVAGTIEEEKLLYDNSSLAEFYDYVVVIDVPRDKRGQQPVQFALKSLDVHEAVLPEDSFAAEKQLRAAQAAEAKTRPYNRPNESNADGIQALDAAEVTSEDLLVVATEDQIKAICDALKRQGLTATLHGNELASVSDESLVRKQELRRDVVGRTRAALNREVELTELEKSNKNTDRANRQPEPSAEKADADKFADAVDAPKPDPAAPAGRPKDSEHEGKAGSAKPATAPAKAKVRRSVSSANKPKEDEEDEKLELDKAADKRSAIVGEDGTRKPDLQLFRKLTESQRRKSPSSYYRQLSVNNQLGQLKEAAKQQGIAGSGEFGPQRLAKGTASRGVSGPAEDAPVDSTGDVATTLSSTSPRVHVRFIIRTIDLPASANAAEEPASKK